MAKKTNLKTFVVMAVLLLWFGCAIAAADVIYVDDDAPPLGEWNKTFGGAVDDRAYSVQQTSDGGYILAGSTGSFGAGDWDFWLVKTDPNGNEQWNKTFGSSDLDWLYSAQQTSDGGYILAGSTYSFGAGFHDFWLVKTDSNGIEDWNNTFGGADYDGASSVQQTSDGGYILAGYTQSFGAGIRDFWLVKTDSNGIEDWNNTFGGAEWDYAESVQQTSDGGYIVAGYTYSFGAGSDDFWLVKTDSNGVEDWNNTFGGAEWDFAESVQQTSDGGYIVAGSTYSFGAGDPDFWLVKTDGNGNEEWNKTFGGSSIDRCWSVQQTSDGGYILAGSTGSFGAGDWDFWLVKTDPNGNEQWNKTFGGSDLDWLYSAQQTSDGGYILAGSTASFGAGNTDFWLVKVGGSAWDNAYKYLQDALADANSNPDVNEIWVAQGIYRPDANSADPNGSGDREAMFQLINGVAIYGGYAGFGESDPNERDVELYETILSGDLNGDDVDVNEPLDLLTEPTRAENSFHVVTGSGTNETAVLDGFTITAGNANGPSYTDPYSQGGGMYNNGGSPKVDNCTFTANSARWFGAGMYTKNSSSTLTHCIFRANSAGNCCTGEGGGMYTYNSSPIVSNCTFSKNWAGGGGGMSCHYSSQTISNCTFSNNSANFGGGILQYRDYTSNPKVIGCIFSGNSARGRGGGVEYIDSSPTLTNCIFTGNSADNGGGMSSMNSSTPALTNCTFTANSAPEGRSLACDSYEHLLPSYLKATNCIFWDGSNEIFNGDSSTIAITYSDVQGSWPGEGNIDADPCFVEPGYWDMNDFWVEGDYHLLAGSPCIDSGDNWAVPADTTDLDNDGNTTEPIPFDLDGNPRFVDRPDTEDTGNGTPPIVDMGAYETALPDPVELLDILALDIIDLGLHHGIENSLLVKLDTALQKLEDDNENNDVAAINSLQAFINAVEAQRGKKIPEEDADNLIAAALQIINLLSTG